jgi:hypothetical protein
LAISSAIMDNVIASKLRGSGIPQSVLDEIKGAQFDVPSVLTSDQVQMLLESEMEGLRGVFWFLLGVSALTFLLSLPVEDHGLPGDEKKAVQGNGDTSTSEKTKTEDLEQRDITLEERHGDTQE